MGTSPEVQAFLNALLDGPALAPPPGVTPNFVNPSDLNTLSRTLQIGCLILATLVVCMRIYTKSRIIRKVVLEDYICVLGWATFMGFYVPVFLASQRKLGVHQWNIQLKVFESDLYDFRNAGIMCGVTDVVVRLSILLQYLRIFAPTRRNNALVFWGSHLLIWVNFVFYVIITFLEIFACSPIEKAWNPLIIDGHCYSIFAIYIAAAAVNTVSNFLIFCLPHSVIWNLQMSRGRKVGISALFIAGLFACMSSVAGLYYRIRVYQTGDISYYYVIAGNWSYPELTFGIMVACLPVSPKFVQAVAKWKCISRMKTSRRPELGSVRPDRIRMPNIRNRVHHDTSLWTDDSGISGGLALVQTSAADTLASYETDTAYLNGENSAHMGPLIARAVHKFTVGVPKYTIDEDIESHTARFELGNHFPQAMGGTPPGKTGELGGDGPEGV